MTRAVDDAISIACTLKSSWLVCSVAFLWSKSAFSDTTTVKDITPLAFEMVVHCAIGHM